MWGLGGVVGGRGGVMEDEGRGEVWVGENKGEEWYGDRGEGMRCGGKAGG